MGGNSNPESQIFHITATERVFGTTKEVHMDTTNPLKKNEMYTINMPTLLACVSGTRQHALSDPKCVDVHGVNKFPKFIEFVSMDVEQNEADTLRTWHALAQTLG